MKLAESGGKPWPPRGRRRLKEEYFLMGGKAQPEEPRCPTIAYLLDNFPPGTLRREQRKKVAPPLDSCPACTERYPNPPHLPRNDGVVQLNTAIITRRPTSKARHPKISFLDGRGQGG